MLQLNCANPDSACLKSLRFNVSTLIVCYSILIFGSQLILVDIIMIIFESCMCMTIPQVLVHNGLFPTLPLQPWVVVSIDLLDFYAALFDWSADAVTALVGTLKAMYSQRRFPVLNQKVSFQDTSIILP